MPFGYVVSQVDVTDPEAFEKYRSQVPQVTEGFGGQYLARGVESKCVLRDQGSLEIER